DFLEHPQVDSLGDRPWLLLVAVCHLLRVHPHPCLTSRTPFSDVPTRPAALGAPNCLTVPATGPHVPPRSHPRIVGAWSIRSGNRNVVKPEVHAILRPVVDDVIEHPR